MSLYSIRALQSHQEEQHMQDAQSLPSEDSEIVKNQASINDWPYLYRELLNTWITMGIRNSPFQLPASYSGTEGSRILCSRAAYYAWRFARPFTIIFAQLLAMDENPSCSRWFSGYGLSMTWMERENCRYQVAGTKKTQLLSKLCR